MSIDKVSDNRAVTGSDGGRSAANLNYILYIVGFFVGITALIGVVLAYSNRETASETFRSHFEWQIKIFWRTVRFFIAISILFFVFSLVAVVTLGLGFVLYLIPFGIWIWWLVSTIKRIAAGMKALGLGLPVAMAAGGAVGSVAVSVPAPASLPAPVASMPPAGWYDDAQRSGHKRWWDGTAWGMTDDEHPSMVSETLRTDAEIVVAPADIVGRDAEVLVAPAEAAVPSAEIAVAPAATPPEPAPETVVATTTVEPSAEVAPVVASPSAPAPAAAPPAARFCENCGAERRPGGRFCTSCGQA